MATRKTQDSFVCALHCLLHVVAFWAMTPASAAALVVIGVTHFLIDRFSFVKVYYTRWVNFGQPDDAPLWLTVWLGIIRDNVFHLLIAYYAIQRL